MGENLELENLMLKGELHDYESALNQAHEIIGLAKHILICHTEEIGCGVEKYRKSKDEIKRLHPATQARIDSIRELIEICVKFERIAPKPAEFPEFIYEK